MMLNIWTMNIRNEVNGKVLDTSTHDLFIKLIFIVFKKKGILFIKNDFDERGEFSGVVKNDWTKKKKEDPTLGTNRTKADYDEYADEKYMNLLQSGRLQPWANHHDLLKCVVMSLGTHLGFRGQREIVSALWSYLRFETLPCGTRRITAAPDGGFDKTASLSINNPIARKQNPVTEDYPSDPFHPVKLICHYRSLCDPEQNRLICHVNTKSSTKYKYRYKNPVGAGPITGWIKEIAMNAKFKDHKLYTPHRNRVRMATSVYSDPAIPDNVKMNQMRHKTMKSAVPYVKPNRRTQQALQNAISGGLVGAANRYPAEAVLPQLKSQQFSGVIGAPQVPIEQQVLPQVPQQQICGVVGTAALHQDGKTPVRTTQQMWPQVGQLQQPTHASTFTLPHPHPQQHGGLVVATLNPNENSSAAPIQHLLPQEQQHREQHQQHTGPKASITEHLPLTTMVLPQATQNTLTTNKPSKKRTHDEIGDYETQLLFQKSQYEKLLQEHSATTSSLDGAHSYIELLESSTKVDDVQHVLNQKMTIIQRMGQEYQQKERDFDMVVTAYRGKTAECNRVEAQRIQLEREVVQQQQQQQQRHHQQQLFQQQQLETKDAEIRVLQQQLYGCNNSHHCIHIYSNSRITNRYII